MTKRPKRETGRLVSVEVKRRVVEERLRGTRQDDVARAFGVSTAAVTKWVKQFREHGAAGLEPRVRKRRADTKPVQTPQRTRVVALRKEHEDWGTRRIRDVLRRFEALGVSEQAVRQILHDEGLIQPSEPRAASREHPPRRFERAAPNQLWQSDIFTFLHRRHERLYVAVFMDDHSRFIVGHALAHHQKSALVMEAFESGIATYGHPTEVLTDNGRQYTVWRGKTEFEETLQRYGIAHIRSRPQHPQTLGKVERFWKTLWDEFLGRTVFADGRDAQHRLEHFIKHYNFQRPHQALDGLVPADRFFKAATHVREAIEREVEANALRLALEQPPRKPFYVVGQLGDQRLSIATGAGGLEVRVGDNTQTIPLKEQADASTTASRITQTTQATESTDSAVAAEANGPGCDREESRADGAVGALGRETGDDGDRRRRNLARLLLSARDEGDQRDAVGAGAWVGRRSELGRIVNDTADRRAGGEGDPAGTGEAASRTPAVRDAQGRPRGGAEDCEGTPAEGNALDGRWEAAFLALGEGEEAASIDTGDFDPDTGWSDRGPLKWDRKLAGADEPGEHESQDDEVQESLRSGTEDTDGSGAATSIRRGDGGARWSADGQRRSQVARDVAQPRSRRSCTAG